MPHQCTECSRTFPDGSKEMLSGCPDCGGNKFQFKPSDAVDVGAGSGKAASGSGGGVGGEPSGDDGGGAMSRAKATVRDLMGRGDDDATGSNTATGSGTATGSNTASAGESRTGQASLSEYSNADASGSATSEASASDSASAPDSASTADSASAADSASTAGSETGTDGASASGSADGEEGRVTPSGSSEWPKSGTEEYDTPADQAGRRVPRDDSDGGGDPTSVESPESPESPASAVQGGTTSEGPTSNPSDAADEDGSITAQMGETEDDAQRSARSDVVSPDELPNRESVAPGGVSDAASSNAGVDRADRPPSSGAADVKDRPSAGDVASEPDGDSPDLDELRDELNSQFESIKVLDPGKYELNLMELYDREEYIISLQEDGRYVIEVPESWRGDASPD